MSTLTDFEIEMESGDGDPFDPAGRGKSLSPTLLCAQCAGPLVAVPTLAGHGPECPCCRTGVCRECADSVKANGGCTYCVSTPGEKMLASWSSRNTLARAPVSVAVQEHGWVDWRLVEGSRTKLVVHTALVIVAIHKTPMDRKRIKMVQVKTVQGVAPAPAAEPGPFEDRPAMVSITTHPNTTFPLSI